MMQGLLRRLALVSCGLLGACGDSGGECNTPVVEQCVPLADVAHHCSLLLDGGTGSCPVGMQAESCFSGSALIDGPSFANGSCCYHTQAMCE